MELIIKSRRHGEVAFRTDGPYICVSIGDGAWRQPCKGGGFRGVTLMYGGNPEVFEARCRRWWRAYLRAARASGWPHMKGQATWTI